ncbi:conserved hypothetical protein [Rhodospirillum rubrum ATCC 11170]|uniref:Nickel transport protein n=2 Tax=Rhodospirillum rubrum TaxID=1085 RepID=Q2RNK2_RHORT|nr:conserved hypothetical protein [Rhodospirillum rubrum ATCC 11170]MBK5956012.1 hypothetical protein [Rhodospirillum rubrum]
MFATVEGAEIVGSAYFGGGRYPQGVTVRFSAPDGRELGTAVTGADGGFRFLAREGVDHVIVVNSGDGHRAEMTVPARDLPPGLPGGAPNSAPAVPVAMASVVATGEGGTGNDLAALAGRDLAALDALLSRKLRPIEDQLDAQDDRIAFHDILGGIGYILGLVGLASLLLARRAKN